MPLVIAPHRFVLSRTQKQISDSLVSTDTFKFKFVEANSNEVEAAEGLESDPDSVDLLVVQGLIANDGIVAVEEDASAEFTLVGTDFGSRNFTIQLSQVPAEGTFEYVSRGSPV